MPSCAAVLAKAQVICLRQVQGLVSAALAVGDTAKELCVHCLRHSNLGGVTLKECTRRKTPPHWLGSEAVPGEGSAAGGGKGGQANVCLPHQHHGEYIDRFARGDLQCRAGHAVQHNTTDVDYRPEHSHRGQGCHTALCWK